MCFTTTSLCFLYSNETLQEKCTCLLRKNTKSCFEKILEPALQKTAAVRPSLFHFTIRPNKIRKHLKLTLIITESHSSMAGCNSALFRAIINTYNRQQNFFQPRV